MPRQLLIMVCVSAFMAFAISFLPSMAKTPYSQEMAVFSEHQQMNLTEQNLVDLFTLMPTHYNIKRVKWENRAIFVDLSVTPEEKLDVPVFYLDTYTLIHRTFRLTKNVEHVFLRLLEEDKQTAKLLVYIQATRPLSIRDLPAPERVTDPQKYVESTFQVRIEPALHERVHP